MPDQLDPQTRASLDQFVGGLLLMRDGADTDTPHLFLSQLPEDFPVELPLPELTHVVGSVAHNATTLEVLLESALNTEALRSAYRRLLGGLAWQELAGPPRYHLGGFIPADFDPARPDAGLHTLDFYQDSSGARLSIFVHPLDTGPTFVRVDLSMDSTTNRRMYRATQHRDAQQDRQVIPHLVPPPGSDQRPRTGSSSPYEFSSMAELSTALEPEAVAAHYAEQLSRAGWTPTERGESGPLAWHSWQFTSEEQEPWTGLFFALQTPEDSRAYRLFVRAARSKSPSVSTQLPAS